ncbi:MAG: T9SS type A sorting domain-containing protein [Ignavibacteria bacterium]|nr:T9SS type A sorting domain-containing protein [Ignavibacteria bacterium]
MKVKIIFSGILLLFLAVFIYNIKDSSLLFNDTCKEKSDKTGKPSGVMQSLQFISDIRAYPDRDIPQDKFYKGFEYSRDKLADVFENDFADAWTSIGPNNIGGRSISLAVHPVDTSIVFIGSASGGIWKSTSGGLGANAWTIINTGYPSLAVSSIVIDSVNPNIMFIGTGENYGYQYSVNNGVNVRVTRGMYGIGILKTTNGGTTWTKSLDWSYSNQRGVWTICQNPKNSNILYASTSEGVYKTYNAGASWVNVLNYQMVMDMLINHIDTNIVYASVGNLSNNIPNANVGIYKSTNGGVNWTKLTGGLPSFWSGKATLQLYRGNPNYIYANIANDITTYVGYYRSTDAGTTWTVGSISVPSSNQGWYNQGHLVKSNDPNQILVGCLDVHKSTNGGTSFSIKSSWSAWNTGATPPGQPEGPSNFVHADVHYYVENPKDPNKIYIAADGGLYRSNNFGETFFSCNGGYVTSQFYASLGNSFTDSIFCVGGLQDNRAAFYQGTTAWYKTFGGDGMCCQVNSQNPQICYTEYTYGAVSRSNNGGVSWSGLSIPGSGSSSNYCFAAPYVVCPSNPSIMYIAGTNFYKSTNGGTSFGTTLNYFGGGKALSMATSWVGTDTIYVGTTPEGSTAAAIWRSLNGGTTWTNISGSAVPNRYPTDLFANPFNAKEVYATFGGFGSAHVLKSTDAGTTWTNITGSLPDVPTQCVMIDPVYPNNIYVGNDLGVYASTNSGTTWGEYRTGMPYSIVFDLAYVPVSRKIRALTHGSGIWERKLTSIPTAVQNESGEMPKEYYLNQNYPNPFNPVTRIDFGVSKQAFVSIIVYDMAGRRVSRLINGNYTPGNYHVMFDAGNLPSGIYAYTMTVNEKTVKTNKLTILK